MPLTRSLATADEIRAYFIEELNPALRRPGMYGNEGALRTLIAHLLFVENEPDAWTEQQSALEDRGAWTSTGVTGAFWDLIPGGSYEFGMASVYSEFAHRRGWLVPDRVLTADNYHALRDRARPWAGEDRVWADVTAEFGTPSILIGGTNPRYGKTLGYLSEDAQEPMVFFHLWNGSAPDAESSWPPEHEEPLLLAVRFGGGLFPATFTFTPEGQRRRPDPDALCR
ncbi:hypothetical protein ACIHCQ_28675 [Streptomyces sp. NPDC052236]|uniref:hypothetical protein n=1 Tax=Streptomyces sp. NPDC052236 TaxID=3365686 RepID=UPI0037CEFA74